MSTETLSGSVPSSALESLPSPCGPPCLFLGLFSHFSLSWSHLSPGSWLMAFSLSLPLCSPLPWVSAFSGCPQPCSVCFGTPSPTLQHSRSRQRPSPMAAAPLAQGPALTVTHRADGGDFDEEATPPPEGACVCVRACVRARACVHACMHAHSCQAVFLPLLPQLGPRRSWEQRATLSLFHPVI